MTQDTTIKPTDGAASSELANAEFFGRPDVNGWYWMRAGEHSSPQVVRVDQTYGQTTICGVWMTSTRAESFVEMYPRAKWSPKIEPHPFR